MGWLIKIALDQRCLNELVYSLDEGLLVGEISEYECGGPGWDGERVHGIWEWCNTASLDFEEEAA